ncbi:hypothetical protein [Petrocella sp. FN5]|uniref:hypothetical protein n=1 Tax=Petrocella sp. FN5 TaxID=3032002 RepID=UPI0023DBB7AD|nr:hypothetical protein [Petrocella sp. FN5]MDF1618013.1 hypothetical protein [Petrocella sp. FN5]
MEQVLWKILGIILSVILMFVVPIMNLYERQDNISYNIITTQLNQMTDSVRDIGGLDASAYHAFLRALDQTGNGYSISLEHYEKVYVPVYNEGGLFMEDYHISYEGFYKDDIEAVLNTGGFYPMNQGDMFFVSVQNVTPTKSQMVRQILHGMDSSYPTLIVRGGGMVRHESY